MTKWADGVEHMNISRLEVKRCGNCHTPYFGTKVSRYCCDKCKQSAKVARRMADPERRAIAEKWRAEYRKNGGRSKAVKYPGDPDWRKRPRTRRAPVMPPDEREKRRKATRRESRHRRRARINGATIGEVTPEGVSSRFAYWGNRCWMCGKDGTMTVDHVKPLSKGGAHMLANIRPACNSCNSRKQGKWDGIESTIALTRESRQ